MCSGIFPRRIGLAVCAAAVVVIWTMSGCGGSSDPFEIVPVSGKVTYEDGTPMPVGRLTVVFTPHAQPIEANAFPRQAQAEVNVADGTFASATTHKFGDGLILGHHSVEVFSYNGKGQQVLVPISPKEIEVSDESTVFEFKIPR